MNFADPFVLKSELNQHGCGQTKHQKNAGVSDCFHLPGLHFGCEFLTHARITSTIFFHGPACWWLPWFKRSRKRTTPVSFLSTHLVTQSPSNGHHPTTIQRSLSEEKKKSRPDLILIVAVGSKRCGAGPCLGTPQNIPSKIRWCPRNDVQQT